jgi:hypothetical protein
MSHRRFPLHIRPLLLTLCLAGCSDDDVAADGTATEGTATDGGSGDGATSDAMDATVDGADTVAAGCATPGAWSAPDWSSNAATALALRAQLDTLVGDPTMRGAETGTVSVTLEDLMAAWDGDPSLAAAANPGYVPVVEAAFAEFLDALAAGDQELLDAGGLWMPGAAGGVWGDDDRGINEGGLEVRQLVDKAGFAGSLMYHYAVTLTEGEITPATLDAIAAAWGTNAELDATGELTDAAGYSYDMGFHGEMATALTAAKAYADDPMCVAERDDAIVTFFQLWERTAVARTVFYGNRAAGKLLAATTGTEFAGVLHDLGEGVGITAGFRGLPEATAGPLAGASRILTDADVDAIMAAYGVDLDDLGASTTGQLLESLPALEAANETVAGVAMDVYGLDAATVAGWIMPTPG